MSADTTLGVLELTVVALAGILVVSVVWQVMCQRVDQREARRALARRQERTRRMERLSDQWRADQ